MPYMSLILGAVAIYWAALVSPGPNFMIITQMSMTRSRIHGFMAALGVTCGGAIWTIAALLGLGILLQAFPVIGMALRIAGGAYLVYIGVMSWRNAGKPLAAAKSEEAPIGLSSAFVRGLFTNLSNPKAAAFFGSIFATFIVQSVPVWVYGVIFLCVVASSLTWHACLAFFFSTTSAKHIYGRAKKTINRVLGTVMVGLGIRLLASRP